MVRPLPDHRTLPEPVGLVVLAGGTSRRWGGHDKTAAELDGRAVLVHVLDGARAGLGRLAGPAVVVAPADHPARTAAEQAWPQLRWTLEHPADGGPAAGLASAVDVLPRGIVLVVVLAGDLPFAGPAIPRLLAALSAPRQAANAAVAVDDAGRRQPLLAAYRLAELTAAFETLGATPHGSAPHGSVHGRSMHAVLALLRLCEVPVSALEAFDLDTPRALETARALLSRRPGHRSGGPRER